MSDRQPTDNTRRGTSEDAVAGQSPSPSRRRWFAGIAALGGAGLLGAAAARAQGWGHGGIDPEERARRMEWRISRVVQEVGGSTEQKDRLVAIARAAIADLKPLREQARELRRQGMALLSAAVIDRTALEQVRSARMQMEDARSRRLVQAFADAVEVFTPEQRLKVAEHVKNRRDHR